MVMAPTRELAEQIEDIVSKLIKFSGLRSVCGVGGKPIEDQGLALRKGVEILIGTPGRLVDLIESRYLVLNQCNYMVLDEADRMVDMGFEESVRTTNSHKAWSHFLVYESSRCSVPCYMLMHSAALLNMMRSGDCGAGGHGRFAQVGD